jgi:hypothetical protein
MALVGLRIEDFGNLILGFTVNSILTGSGGDWVYSRMEFGIEGLSMETWNTEWTACCPEVVECKTWGQLGR